MPPIRRPAPALPMVESAFLASATALIFFINFYFPLGPLLRMFFPIPIALAYLRWDRRAAIMTMIVTFLLLTVLMGPTRSIQFLIPHGFIGLFLGALWRRRSPWLASIFTGTVLGTLGSIFQLYLVSLLLGENVWIYLTSQAAKFVGWIMGLLGSLDEPQLLIVQIVTAGGIVFSSLMYMILVHLVAWVLLERLGNPISPAPQWVENLLD
ncbi:Protein of unknown function DUF2232, membrane [Thalassoporum mexicanum PCC 7367]|uniref:DUF2232 domain-containing protein n=1 Tax=Thalassoporum mexicanum TaxID=3457544 RepID=UPI00029FE9F7|nr:DUF2232 domain-containing protein [Pseudanabaena sp. PCC 7367]AFY71163.1 Protein of unknown function DUF2232, membrane [Pseudanabaena sp. PCC 7367]